MSLYKHSTKRKTDLQTATKHKRSCVEMLYLQDFLKIFAKARGKHLCQRLFKVKFQS